MKMTVTSARKTGRPWRRPNAGAISAATDPPAHPTRPQKVTGAAECRVERKGVRSAKHVKRCILVVENKRRVV